MAVYRDNIPKHSDMEHFISYLGTGRNTAADLPPESCMTDNAEKNDNKSTKKDIIGSLLEEFLDGVMDSDKLLIAAILYMLMKEGADIKLIIALGYIIM